MIKRYSTNGFSEEQLKSLENLPKEKWEFIEGYKKYYMISNYGRVKANSRPNKTGKNILSARIISQVYNKKTGQTNVKLRIDGKQSTVCVKSLLNKYFPDEECLKKIEEKEAEARKQTRREIRYGKYKTYNIFTKEERYYKDREAIEKELGIPRNIINRIINNQIPDFMGLKIYVTERGGKDYCHG